MKSTLTLEAYGTMTVTLVPENKAEELILESMDPALNEPAQVYMKRKSDNGPYYSYERDPAASVQIVMRPKTPHVPEGLEQP